MKKDISAKKSFTLVELMVVIAIIGLLSSIILINLSGAQEKAKVASAVETIGQVRLALELYADATGNYPTDECMLNCTQATDPFLNSLGKPGWGGPYMPLWSLAHPWKGHIGVSRYAGGDNWDDDSEGECIGIWLDDDRLGLGSNDNGGRIPKSALLKIDEIIDDGDLATGRARGGYFTGGTPAYIEGEWRRSGVLTIFAVPGEMVISIGCYKP